MLLLPLAHPLARHREDLQGADDPLAVIGVDRRGRIQINPPKTLIKGSETLLLGFLLKMLPNFPILRWCDKQAVGQGPDVKSCPATDDNLTPSRPNLLGAFQRGRAKQRRVKLL